MALTFPLVLHLTSVVPHDVGDPLLSTAILWWNAHVVPFTTQWWNGFAFYPAPGFMAFSDPRLGESLLATPLQWLGCTPVAAYNLRFGMLAMLALAVTGALSFGRLSFGFRLHRTVLAAVVLGIVADGWIFPLALPAVPEMWTTSRAQGFATVLELPLGDTFSDLAAMYRTTLHHRPIVNGNSGFEPRHYSTLRTALEERDATAFDGLPAQGRLLVVVNKRDDTNGSWDRFLVTHPRGTRIGEDDHWSYYAIEPQVAEPPPCTGQLVPITSTYDDHGVLDAPPPTDVDPHGWWAVAHPRRVGRLVLALGHLVRPCNVTIAPEEFVISYPRKLVVETSTDNRSWIVVADRRLAGLTMSATLENPKQVAVSIPLTPSDARFVRLRIDEAHGQVAWRVADLTVRSAHQSD